MRLTQPIGSHSAPKPRTSRRSIDVVRADALTSDCIERWRSIQDDDESLASPFFCPDFTMTVASVREDVRIAVIHDARGILGFFPFQRGRFGTGRPVGSPLSDYHGLICAEGTEVDLAELLRACSLSTWDFDHVPRSQPVFAPFVQRDSISHLMDLGQGYEQYVARTVAKGSKVVKKTERLTRQLHRERGEPVFRHDCTDRSALDRLFELKSSQYHRSALIDVFSYQWARELMENILTRSNRSFSGMLSVMTVGDELAAVHMGMRSRQVWHWWFPAHDPGFARYSPGIMLSLDAARHAPSIGVTHIDLGKGEAAYKSRLKTSELVLWEGTAERANWTASLRRARSRGEEWLRDSQLYPLLKYPGRLLKSIERRARFR